MKALRTIAVNGWALGLICCVVAATLASPVRAEDEVAAAANSARVLTKAQLESMYAGRSWLWKDGAGYFQSSKRAFTAWVNEGATASYATGIWSADNKGRLCFSATWYSLQGNKKALTCFDHRTDDKNIYQRRWPDGGWYIFSHLPAQSDDEIQKLQQGDHVSEIYQRNKRYIAEQLRSEKK